MKMIQLTMAESEFLLAVFTDLREAYPDMDQLTELEQAIEVIDKAIDSAIPVNFDK